MKKEFSMVVIGELTLDDILKFDQPPLIDCPGGAALYAIGGAFMWRRDRMGFVTRKGCDFDLSVVEAATEGLVDMSGVIAMKEYNIHLWNLFDRMDHRYFIYQRWGSSDAVMAPYPEDIPEKYLCGSEAFLVAAVAVKWQREIIRCLPDDAIVMVDPHFDGMYKSDNEAWFELLHKITIFSPSEEEFIRFFDIDKKDDLANYVPYMRKIAEYGSTVVCVKVGARGVLTYDRNKDECWHLPAYQDSKIVDVTGCGDTFAGGFLSDYLDSRDAYQATMHGIISSSMNIERLGSMSNFEIENQDVVARYEMFNKQFDREKQRVY